LVALPKPRPQVTGRGLTWNFKTKIPGSPCKTNKTIKKWLGGRYLATFSSNCFAINENQVAELVAAAILVATSGVPRSQDWAHFTGNRQHEFAGAGQGYCLDPSRIFTGEGGHTLRLSSRFLRLRSGFRLRTQTPAVRLKLSKNELQAAYPWGLGWSHRKLNTCQVFNNSIYIVI